MPVRGILSSEGPESGEIMVNLAWEYTDSELANNAENKITFLLQYLDINLVQPDIIRNWNV